MAIKRADLAWITVSNLNKAKNFFVDTLGLELREEDAKIKWLELSGAEGGALLGVAEKDGACSREQPGSNAILTFKVDDIVTTRKAFEAKGVNFFGPTIEIGQHVKLAFFTDSDGNKFQLVEEAAL